MELIEIAQLVTGLATLIVASVLIWQMFIQKKTLDIAHNDADSSMSLTAVENKINLNTWFSTNSSIEMMEKMDESLESLNPKEKDILSSYVYGHVLLLITEYRLGRMSRNPLYTTFSLRDKAMMGEFKAMRDLFQKLYTDNIDSNFTLTSEEFMNIGKDLWEKIENKKIGV